MIIDIHGHYTTEPQALHLFRDRQLAGLADPARKPASTDLGISDEVLVKSVEPQLRFQKERGSDLTIFSPRASGMAHHVGSEAVSRQWTTVCNDLIHRICTLLPDNFVARRPAAPVSRRVARELHSRARTHRQRARLRRRQPQSRPDGRLLDRSAADRSALVPDLRETVRARGAGDDSCLLVLQSEFPRDRRALPQRRHDRLHAADSRQSLQGFPDAEIRHPARRRGGAVPLGPLPRHEPGHEETAARRTRDEERVFRHLRLPSAGHRVARQGRFRPTTSCSRPR